MNPGKFIRDKWGTAKRKISVPFLLVKNHYRFFLITAIGLIELLLIHYERDFLDKLFAEPFNVVIPLFAAAPIALFIWYWRDQNKKADIQNAKEELIQKDFHEIQKWAIGIEGDKERTLQIAAIHQLKPYAIGKHGERFRRPAYEIYFSLLQNWEMEELGKDEVTPNYIKAIHTVFREEGSNITNNMSGIYLRKANLKKTILSCQNLFRADLNMAELCEADLRASNFKEADLRFANLSNSNLQSANLRRANLSDANFYLANLQSANLVGALFGKIEVILAKNWDKAIYPEDVLKSLQKLYEELKESRKNEYWDPETKKYISDFS